MEQLGHLVDCQPDRLALQPNFDAEAAILGLIHPQLSKTSNIHHIFLRVSPSPCPSVSFLWTQVYSSPGPPCMKSNVVARAGLPFKSQRQS